MVTILNFSGVLEIAFGLNASLFILEIVPLFEERLAKLAEQHEQARKAKIAATGDNESFPTGFFVSCKYELVKVVFKPFSVIGSVISLAILIYAGFNPTSQMSGWIMGSVLALLFAIPAIAVFALQRILRFTESTIDLLESQTAKAKRHHLTLSH